MSSIYSAINPLVIRSDWWSHSTLRHEVTRTNGDQVSSAVLYCVSHGLYIAIITIWNRFLRKLRNLVICRCDCQLWQRSEFLTRHSCVCSSFSPEYWRVQCWRSIAVSGYIETIWQFPVCKSLGQDLRSTSPLLFSLCKWSLLLCCYNFLVLLLFSSETAEAATGWPLWHHKTSSHAHWKESSSIFASLDTGDNFAILQGVTRFLHIFCALLMTFTSHVRRVRWLEHGMGGGKTPR